MSSINFLTGKGHVDTATVESCWPTIGLPSGILIETVEAATLPASWRHNPYRRELQLIGEKWLLAESSVCLRVPSAVKPEEFNLLINPLHKDFIALQFLDPVEFRFDPRMWK